MTPPIAHSGSGAWGGYRSLLFVLCTAQFVVVLDVNIVNVALPGIRRDLGLTTSDLAWVISAYALTFGSLLLVSGRIGDVVGRRRLFAIGLGLFAAGSLSAGLADSSMPLIGGRVVQGIGAACLSPTGLAIISATFKERAARNRALALWAAAAALGAASGQAVGGAVISLFSWRAAFLINIPVCIAALPLVAAIDVPRRARGVRRRSLDFGGALLVVGGLAALVYVLRTIRQTGIASVETFGPIALAVVLLGAFIRAERRHEEPLLPAGMLELVTVEVGNIATAVTAGAAATTGYFATLYLQQVLRWSPAETGLGFLPFTVAVVASSALVPRLAARFLNRWLLVAGLTTMAAAAALFVALPTRGGYLPVVLPSFVLLGAGLGVTSVMATGLATRCVHDESQGAAAGLVATSEQIGTAIVLLALTALAGSAQTSATPAGQVGGFRAAEGAAAALLAAVAALTALLLSTRRAVPLLAAYAATNPRADSERPQRRGGNDAPGSPPLEP
jgi:MFS family permease